MPNWVYNSLSVEGDAKEFWDLSLTTPENEFTFAGVVPEPVFENKNEAGVLPDWYTWRVDNWGTKWDAGHAEWIEENEIINFSTAWSPPLEWLESAAKMFPNLIFHLSYEEEQGWGGEITIKGSEVLSHEEWDIPDSHAELMERKGYCWACEWAEGDEEMLFSDCPREIAS